MEPTLRTKPSFQAHVLSLCLMLTLSAAAADAVAGGPDSGVYLGGGPIATWVNGTGTWDVYEFEIGRPLATEGAGAVGLAWTDQILLGLKPVVGYRINPALAVQVGYGVNITKSSQQSYGETSGTLYYEQGMKVEWKQRDLEILGVFQSGENLKLALFGGLDLISVTTDILLYEGAEYEDSIGDLISVVDSQNHTDKLSTTGIVVGAGVEIPSDNERTEVFVSAQYLWARTDETFFGTENFKVDMGGVSFMAGVRWFPFSR